MTRNCATCGGKIANRPGKPNRSLKNRKYCCSQCFHRAAKVRRTLVDETTRFMGFVSPEPNTGCWLWMGASRREYGLFTVRRKHVSAHRYSFGRHHKLDQCDVVRHVCHTPLCVNPDHLVSGTHADNVGDKIRAGRQLQGEDVPTSKLDSLDVLRIRISRALGVKRDVLGRRFGVHPQHISVLSLRTQWRHIPSVRVTDPKAALDNPEIAEAAILAAIEMIEAGAVVPGITSRKDQVAA